MVMEMSVHLELGQTSAGGRGALKVAALSFGAPLHFSFLKKKKLRDFPGGTVVKDPPANAGDTVSSPGPGRFKKIPQAAEQLSLCTTTTEPAL